MSIFYTRLVRRVDVARAFLRTTLQLIGYVAELVRMMLAHQLAVGTLDLGIAGAAVDAEHGVGVLPARRRGRPARALAAVRVDVLLPIVRRDVGVALHHRDTDQLTLVDAERGAELAHDHELGRRERTVGADDVEQQVDENEGTVAMPARPRAQLHDRVRRRIAGLFARGELLDRGVAQIGGELQTCHQILGRGDLGLGHASVRLRDRTGQAEQRRDEGHRRGIDRAAEAAHAAVENMPEQHADDDRNRVVEHAHADREANKLAPDVHARLRMPSRVRADRETE